MVSELKHSSLMVTAPDIVVAQLINILGKHAHKTFLYHFSRYTWVGWYHVPDSPPAESLQIICVKLSCSSVGVPHFLFIVSRWGNRQGLSSHISILSLGFS